MIKFKGDDLFVNAVGPIIIKVIDEQNNVLATESIKGDSICHLVTFRNSRFFEIINGEIVHLRFFVKEDGKLFSFSIK